MDKTIVYADSCGRWHALIPESAAPLFMAEHLIADELDARGDGDIQHLSYVLENIRQLDTQDKPGFIHFVEYQLDKDVA